MRAFAPALPEVLRGGDDGLALRDGSYLVQYQPLASPLVVYDGTLRVHTHAGGTTASGDLYQRPIALVAERPLLGAGPEPALGIPILARAQYRYYLRVTRLTQDLTFELHRFDATSESWNNEGEVTAKLRRATAPADHLAGEVVNAAGAVIGRLSLGWVSSYLRKATVEIDTVAVSEAPLSNGADKDWASVFDEIGWQVHIVNSNRDVAEPSGESWSEAEMHAALLARRDSVDLDRDWRYHILAVQQIDSTPRGIMYDNGATDSNRVPREGVCISSHWIIPNDAEWGLVRGVRFGAAKSPFFRTAVHELGHAFGLYHNTIDLGFMNTTDVIAASATAETPFPNNIQWAYAEDDLKRLRHMPDIYVRPGGTPFGTDYAATPISPDALSISAAPLELSAAAVLDVLPIGAPVRVDLQLVNRGTQSTRAPSSISLGSGVVRGSVRGPDGVLRTFSPLVFCVDCEPLQPLAAAAEIASSLTLLRGPKGALFPVAGAYAITVEVAWALDGVERKTSATTRVYVTQAKDEAHARAALTVLSEPELLLTLVLGGDHLDAGNAALQAALASPVLRPHFAYTEAKRRLQRFYTRQPDPRGALEVLDDTSVMSRTEAAKLQRKLHEYSGQRAAE